MDHKYQGAGKKEGDKETLGCRDHKDFAGYSGSWGIRLIVKKEKGKKKKEKGKRKKENVIASNN